MLLRQPELCRYLSQVSKHLTIETNGEERQIETGSTILDLLRALDLDPRTVAIELNRSIVRRDEFAGTMLNDGDQVELVHFVGGG